MVAASSNPIAKYKAQEGLTYPELAARLGISESYARQLGSGHITSVSPALADKIERRSKKKIRFDDVMDWVRRGARARKASR